MQIIFVDNTTNNCIISKINLTIMNTSLLRVNPLNDLKNDIKNLLNQNLYDNSIKTLVLNTINLLLQGQIHQYGAFTLYDYTKCVVKDSKSVKLTTIEYNLLKFFINNVNKLLSIETITKTIWNNKIQSNGLNVYVHRLRKKLQTICDKNIIISIYKIGYKMDNINVNNYL